MRYYKLFGFVKQIFNSAMMLFGYNLSSVNPLKCISMNNQECNVRPENVHVNGDELVFFPSNIKIRKCSSSCNNVNNPYAEMWAPDVIKNINVKVFNLMSRANEKRHTEWYETCKCKCRLDANVFHNKQRSNEITCRSECKELIDKGVCDKGFIWNLSNCECECDKSCNHLDYENCKCRKKIVDKLVEECSESVEEVKLAKITSAEHGNFCKRSCSLYIVLL